MMIRRPLTPNQAAEILGTSGDHVRELIDAGLLVAHNTSLGKTPRWKIDPDSIEDFKRQRSNVNKVSNR